MRKFALIALIAVGLVGGSGYLWLRDRPYYPLAGIAVPADKIDYVGLWRGDGRMLRIDAGGKVQFERSSDGAHVELNLPLQAFSDRSFTLGALFWGTTFEVESPPNLVADRWHMTLDGFEMIREAGPSI